MTREKKVWLVVQVGGSSREWYPSTYDSEELALDAIQGHEEASYSAFGPIELEITERVNEKATVSESDLLEVIQQIGVIAP